jgi:drug/metabolite transporter (DMT)-like permease
MIRFCGDSRTPISSNAAPRARITAVATALCAVRKSERCPTGHRPGSTAERNWLRRHYGGLEKRMRDRLSGFANPWLQLTLSVVCVLVSEFLLKRGAIDIAEPDSAFSWTGINGLASPLVWWAILLIIASFVSWLYVLRYIPLTIAFPLSRVVDILVPLGCWIFLGESISSLRWCGIALVIIGLALVAKPVAQIEERL